MYERFTERARKAMQLANQEAQRFGHEYIGVEHLLLGITKKGRGSAAAILNNQGVDLRTIRIEVERIMQPVANGGKAMMERLPHTPRLKIVVETAIAEAAGMGHNYVGTEHLLFGILKHADGDVFRMLASKGVTLDGAKAEFAAMTGGEAKNIANSWADSVLSSVKDVGKVLSYSGDDLVFFGVDEAAKDGSFPASWAETVKAKLHGGVPAEIIGLTEDPKYAAAYHAAMKSGSTFHTHKQSAYDETQGSETIEPPRESTYAMLSRLAKFTERKLDELATAVADLQASVKPAPLLVKLGEQFQHVDASALADAMKHATARIGREILAIPDGMEVLSSSGYRIETEVDGTKKVFEAPTREEVLTLMRQTTACGDVVTDCCNQTCILPTGHAGKHAHVDGLGSRIEWPNPPKREYPGKKEYEEFERQLKFDWETGAITQNEGRARRGFDPLPDGDVTINQRKAREELSRDQKDAEEYWQMVKEAQGVEQFVADLRSHIDWIRPVEIRDVGPGKRILYAVKDGKHAGSGASAYLSADDWRAWESAVTVEKSREASFTQGVKPGLASDMKAMANLSRTNVTAGNFKTTGEILKEMGIEHPATDDQPPDDDDCQPVIVGGGK